jgi:hypothetical protein
MIQKIKQMFSKVKLNERDVLYREWDKARARAITQSELSEIDAIFARHL